MAEYIEREALVDVLAVSHSHHANNSREAALLDRDIRLIWEQPAADVAPVVHGTWEVVHGVFTPGGDPLLRCPVCKARESEHLCGVECRTVWHYCPVCGAHLEEGGAE